MRFNAPIQSRFPGAFLPNSGRRAAWDAGRPRRPQIERGCAGAGRFRKIATMSAMMNPRMKR